MRNLHVYGDNDYQACSNAQTTANSLHRRPVLQQDRCSRELRGEDDDAIVPEARNLLFRTARLKHKNTHQYIQPTVNENAGFTKRSASIM
jgi:hypothetical protein